MLNRKRRRETPPASNAEEQLNPHGGFGLLDLPSSIIIEILKRTPIKETLHCRCVCKTLRRLISDPYFVKDFIARTPFFSLVRRSKNNCHFVKLRGSREFARGCMKLKPVNTSFTPKVRSIEVVGYSNGVICFWDSLTDNLYITNPVLGEFALLPNPWSYTDEALDLTYGFCFCPSTGQYKVIKIKTRRAFLPSNQRRNYRKTEVWVLVVGSDTWRYVGDAPFPLFGKFCNVILNGRLHWIVDRFDTKFKEPISLHSLDIKEELVHPVPAPSDLGKGNLRIELGVLGNSLCLLDNSPNFHVEIWTMREYGIATSWTKDCISTWSIGAQSLRSLAVVSHRMFLMSCYCGQIFCYDPKKGKFAKVYEFHGDGRDEVVLYTPSFLSLEHVSSGACLKVKKFKSYA